jgi:hypothetical protein
LLPFCCSPTFWQQTMVPNLFQLIDHFAWTFVEEEM